GIRKPARSSAGPEHRSTDTGNAEAAVGGRVDSSVIALLQVMSSARAATRRVLAIGVDLEVRVDRHVVTIRQRRRGPGRELELDSFQAPGCAGITDEHVAEAARHQRQWQRFAEWLVAYQACQVARVYAGMTARGAPQEVARDCHKGHDEHYEQR